MIFASVRRDCGTGRRRALLEKSNTDKNLVAAYYEHREGGVLEGGRKSSGQVGVQ